MIAFTLAELCRFTQCKLAGPTAADAAADAADAASAAADAAGVSAASAASEEEPQKEVKTLKKQVKAKAKSSTALESDSAEQRSAERYDPSALPSGLKRKD